MPMIHGMNLVLVDMRESLVADVKRILVEEGLPDPKEDGSP